MTRSPTFHRQWPLRGNSRTFLLMLAKQTNSNCVFSIRLCNEMIFVRMPKKKKLPTQPRNLWQIKHGATRTIGMHQSRPSKWMIMRDHGSSHGNGDFMWFLLDRPHNLDSPMMNPIPLYNIKCPPSMVPTMWFHDLHRPWFLGGCLWLFHIGRDGDFSAIFHDHPVRKSYEIHGRFHGLESH